MAKQPDARRKTTITRYKEGRDKGLTQAEATIAAGERSVRQMGRVLDEEPVDGNTAPGLYKRLALFGAVVSAKAISVNYRAMAFGPDSVRACAPWAEIQARTATGLDDEICVDGANFLAQVKDAPERAPFVMRREGNGLRWECGPARGRLPQLDATVATPATGKATHPVGPDFGAGLRLGALACFATALTRAQELQGVQIYNRNGHAYAASSDSTIVAACCLGEALPIPKGKVVTLNSEGAALLAELTYRRPQAALNLRHDPGGNREAEQQELIDRLPADLQAQVAKGLLSLSAALKQAEEAPPEVRIGIGTMVHCATADIDVQLHQLNPLRYDLAEKIAPYAGGKQVVELKRETLAAFIRRAEGLAEIRAETLVELAVSDGAFTMAFKEALSGEAEEQYRVEGVPKFTVPPVRLEARRLARALAAATELVFDYAKQHVLILRGPNEFLFGVSGRR